MLTRASSLLHRGALIALGALLFWRVARTDVNAVAPRLVTPSDSKDVGTSRDSRVTARRIVWAVEFALLVAVLGVAGVYGWEHRPVLQSPPTLPAPITVNLPFLGDAADPNKYQMVKVWETRSGSNPEPLHNPAGGPMPPIPAAGISRISVSIELQRPLLPGERFDFSIAIPRGAAVENCGSRALMPDCSTWPEQPLPPDVERPPMKSVNLRGTVRFKTEFLAVDFDVRSDRPISYATSGVYTRVQVAGIHRQSPPLNLTPEELNSKEPIVRNDAPRYPTHVRTTIGITNGENLSWSSDPQVAGQWGSRWDYTTTEDNALPPISVTGTDFAEVERRQGGTFFSGAALGVGGGALVALLQVLVRWPRREAGD